MQPLDPIRIPLSGRHLIEASAGTGKTYTITGLYLRLLVEHELSPDKILVVTYTEAACQELREKIRARLAAALSLLETGASRDAFLVELFQRYRLEGRDLLRLQGLISLALINFDLAAVFTIHGFCMRVLEDSAFESGFPFEMEFIEDDHDLLQQVIDDYWRLHSPAWPEELVVFLHQDGVSPDTLLERLRIPLRAYLIRGATALRHGPMRTPQAVDRSLLPRLKGVWQSERAAIISLLNDSPALSRSEKHYRYDRLDEVFLDLDDYCDGEGLDASALIPPLASLATLSQRSLVLGTKPKQVGNTPSHPFFSLADQLMAELQEARTGLFMELILHCHQALHTLKAESGLVSFDDLLTGVRAGLRAEEGGQALAARVITQYPVALIDEFQDTDPVQYEIFTTIYQTVSSVLFMVGDPKQAIYGFRGADLFSYLQAATAEAGRGHTLTTNWRSEPSLIRACNALFGRHEAPFLLPGVDYREVLSPDLPRRRLAFSGMDLAALTLVTFPDQQDREEARVAVARWVALAVQALLAAAARGELYFEESACEGTVRGQALGPKDIAILVRNHREGQLVKEALAGCGLSAVTSSRQSVFATEEAREFVLLLEAVASPQDERKVRCALASRILGHDAHHLVVLEEMESLWEETLERFAEYHRRWQERGVAAMLNHLWAREGVLPRLARQSDGERRLTNLRHLLELAQEAELSEALEPAGLLRWLAERRQSDRPGEASLLRLESDENLIKIVTVHKSKGLQYPVVFAPFFWDSSFMDTRKPQVVECHDESGSLVVDLGSEEFPGNLERQRRERLAEELRLLYVALTRAENRCFLYWGRVQSRKRWATATSPLDYLLRGQGVSGEGLIASLEEGFAERTPEEHLAWFDALALASTGSLRRSEADTWSDMADLPLEETVALGGARPFNRTLHPYLGLHSFTSLHQAGSDDYGHAVGQPDTEAARQAVALENGAEQTPQGLDDAFVHSSLVLDEGFVQSSLMLDEGPDHDRLLVASPSGVGRGGTSPLTFAETAPGGRDMFAFPRGAQAGSCLHAILEEFDFCEQDQEVLTALIRAKLLLFGFEMEWTPAVLGLLSRLVETTLDAQTGLRLADIQRQSRLDELEFYYRLPALPAQALREMLQRGDSAGNEPTARSAFMKGFIDLVFQWQGRYYIVDYKSNYLGPALTDYHQTTLDLAMRHSGYDLQYRIYTVALDRYLRRRLPGYDYDRHFGGVYYLFLRGLDLTLGPEFGVYRARPLAQELKAMQCI